MVGSGGKTAGRKTDEAAADLVIRLQNDRFCILAECCGDCLAWSRQTVVARSKATASGQQIRVGVESGCHRVVCVVDSVIVAQQSRAWRLNCHTL